MNTARARRHTRTRADRFGFRTLCVVVGLELIAGRRGRPGTARAAHGEARLEALGARVTAMRNENLALNSRFAACSEDPAAIEELARQELGLIKPGEIVFTIRDIPAQ